MNSRINRRVLARAFSSPGRRWIILAGCAILAACVAGAALAGAGSPQAERKVVKKEVVSASKGETPYLGVTMQVIDDDLRKGLDLKVKNGVLISQVMDDSPAAEAGIEDGDIIVEFNGKRVDSPSELKDFVALTKVGDTVKVKVVRDGDSKVLRVTIGERPVDEELSESDTPEHIMLYGSPAPFMWHGDGKNIFIETMGRGRLGVEVTDINADLAPYFGVKEGDGVLVLGVKEESVAATMGIKSGDVIVKVGDAATESVEKLVEAVGDLQEGAKFDVTLIRSKAKMTLQGEAPENLAEHFSKGGKEFTVRIPSIEKLKMKGVHEEEMDKLRQEMKDLQKDIQKEIESLRKEIQKAKESK